ncbi:hypothetical protein MBOE_11260 [Mycolicibacterium boenickei]|uniref:Uncharacterized protein n=1 Tax=Mycolicibacterium boenickei TaxID=146017 RepID=A0ABM7IRQ4_9MYCO|nr:hypothetical protein MBOE_11260 [Mycolicibacterium boenickei]
MSGQSGAAEAEGIAMGVAIVPSAAAAVTAAMPARADTLRTPTNHFYHCCHSNAQAYQARVTGITYQ